MKIAYISENAAVRNDNIYVNRDGEINDHIYLKEELNSRGIEIHTVDVYEDLYEVDWFLFKNINVAWLKKLNRLGILNRAVYYSLEPPVVVKENDSVGYRKISSFFGNILTWNDELVDNTRIFKTNIIHYFVKEFGNTQFDSKKLLVNISGNKTSKHKQELYSERAKVIDWYEKNAIDDFDLYGFGWKKKKNPSYQGSVVSKSETYHRYKFALCLENMKGTKGYITEKIYDCLAAGIVPIYGGADNIDVFVPKECYIDYFQFESINELDKYIRNMKEEEYDRYIEAIDSFFESNNSDQYSAKYWTDCFINMNEKGRRGLMHLSIKDYIKLDFIDMSDNVQKLALKTRIMISKKIKRK